MKKRRILIGVSIASMLLTGCVGESTNTEHEQAEMVEKDISTYVHETLPTLGKQEDEAIGLYHSVTGDDYTDDETLYNTVADEVLPKYGDFIEDLEEIEFETEELAYIHEIYIEGVNIQRSAMATILIALEEDDSEKADEANTKLAEGRALLRDFETKLVALAKENNEILNK